MSTRREFIMLLGGAAVRRWSAQDRPARILYFTHSAGYRHDVLPASRMFCNRSVRRSALRSRHRRMSSSSRGELAALRRHNVFHYR